MNSFFVQEHEIQYYNIFISYLQSTCNLNFLCACNSFQIKTMEIHFNRVNDLVAFVLFQNEVKRRICIGGDGEGALTKNMICRFYYKGMQFIAIDF